jgi:ABC-type proline/glycine betaine transport system substrate-binding protein
VHVSTIKSLLMLLALLVAPAALTAQQPTAPPPPSPEVQGWITEIQQLEQRLGPIQARAMEDAGLQQAQTELNAAIVTALMQSTPEVQADLRRIETIQPELRAAQEAGDEEQLRRLVTEAQQLQQRLGEAQMRVLQQPEIAAQAEAFQTRLEARMIEIEPQAEAMLQRFLSLQTQILAAMQNQPGS